MIRNFNTADGYDLEYDDSMERCWACVAVLGSCECRVAADTIEQLPRLLAGAATIPTPEEIDEALRDIYAQEDEEDDLRSAIGD